MKDKIPTLDNDIDALFIGIDFGEGKDFSCKRNYIIQDGKLLLI